MFRGLRIFRQKPNQMNTLKRARIYSISTQNYTQYWYVEILAPQQIIGSQTEDDDL